MVGLELVEHWQQQHLAVVADRVELLQVLPIASDQVDHFQQVPNLELLQVERQVQSQVARLVNIDANIQLLHNLRDYPAVHLQQIDAVGTSAKTPRPDLDAEYVPEHSAQETVLQELEVAVLEVESHHVGPLVEVVVAVYLDDHVDAVQFELGVDLAYFVEEILCVCSFPLMDEVIPDHILQQLE